jgi:hypothetical protein
MFVLHVPYKKMCKFFKWLHTYGEFLTERHIPAPFNLNRTIEYFHMKKVESNVNQQ